MIYDVIDLIDTKLQDETVGLNARIAAVDALKGTTTPDVNEFLIWDQKKLPSAFDAPTVLVVWEGTRDMDLVSQGKWNSGHLISIQYFTDEKESDQARKDVAITASAMRSFIDYMADQGTILEITDLILTTGGWPVAGKAWTWFTFAARYKERDENPIIIEDA